MLSFPPQNLTKDEKLNFNDVQYHIDKFLNEFDKSGFDDKSTMLEELVELRPDSLKQSQQIARLLRSALSDLDGPTRAIAAACLRFYNPKDAEFVILTLNVLADAILTDLNSKVQEEASKSIHFLLPHALKDPEYLENLFWKKLPQQDFPAHAAIILGLSASEQAIKPLMAGMAHPDLELQIAIVWALSRLAISIKDTRPLEYLERISLDTNLDEKINHAAEHQLVFVKKILQARHNRHIDIFLPAPSCLMRNGFYPKGKKVPGTGDIVLFSNVRK